MFTHMFAKQFVFFTKLILLFLKMLLEIIKKVNTKERFENKLNQHLLYKSGEC